MNLPHNNQRLAQKYFDSLPKNSLDRKYYDGLKYQTPSSFLNRFQDKMFQSYQKLQNLEKFYPYQKTIRATALEYETDAQDYYRNSLIFTGLSWFTIYQFAKKGQVFPILKQYGTFLQTHRVFRQYLYTLCLPLIYSQYHLANKYYTHIETLQHVHANRLNNHMLEDPLYTYYPESLRAPKNNLRIKKLFRDSQN